MCAAPLRMLCMEVHISPGQSLKHKTFISIANMAWHICGVARAVLVFSIFCKTNLNAVTNIAWACKKKKVWKHKAYVIQRTLAQSESDGSLYNFKTKGNMFCVLRSVSNAESSQNAKCEICRYSMCVGVPQSWCKMKYLREVWAWCDWGLPFYESLRPGIRKDGKMFFSMAMLLQGHFLHRCRAVSFGKKRVEDVGYVVLV